MQPHTSFSEPSRGNPAVHDGPDADDQTWDVVICGLGPVGAVLANLLGARGVATLVLEAGQVPYELPRAIRFDDEAMRVFQSLGLADRVLPRVALSAGMQFLDKDGNYLCGYRSARRQAPSGWAFSYLFYQPDLEELLRDHLASYPAVTVRTRSTVTALVEDHDMVAVHAEGPDGSTVVKASFVIGCDGARSTVRSFMPGTTLDDHRYDEDWLVLDAVRTGISELPDITTQVCDPARPTTFLPGVGSHVRWEFKRLDGETAEHLLDPATIDTLLSTWIDPHELDVVRAAVYTFHAVVAQGWRAGRLLLAGDAAHQTPPFLAQGLCGGIRDAANLAWKIEAIVRHGLSSELLDSYEVERRPHFTTILGHAMRAGRIVSTTDVNAATERDRLFLADVAAGRDPLGDYKIPGLTDGLLGEPVDAGAARGVVFPQYMVEAGDGRTVRFDDVAPAGPLLVAAADGADEMLGQHAQAAGLAIVRVAASDADAPADCHSDELCDWLDLHGSVVVRPDRYVFGANSDREAVVRLVEQWAGLVPVDPTVSATTEWAGAGV